METLVWLGSNPANVSGVSYKVYQAKVCGSKITATWGPVSVVKRQVVRGWVQTNIKEYNSPALAQRAFDTLLESKYRKGYTRALPAQIPA